MPSRIDAEVVLDGLQPQAGGDPALYVIRSTGVISPPRTQDPDAHRTLPRRSSTVRGRETRKL